jgi:hypothetical protein
MDELQIFQSSQLRVDGCHGVAELPVQHLVDRPKAVRMVGVHESRLVQQVSVVAHNAHLG